MCRVYVWELVAQDGCIELMNRPIADPKAARINFVWNPFVNKTIADCIGLACVWMCWGY